MPQLTVQQIRELTEKFYKTRPAVIQVEETETMEHFIYNEESLKHGGADHDGDVMYPDRKSEDPKVYQHRKIVEQLNETYRDKNQDYGDAFGKSLDKRGLVAALVRMDDKMGRFENLSETEEVRVNDESLRDTLLDLANYAIMTAMWIDNQKFTVSAGELAITSKEQERLEKAIRGYKTDK